MPARSTAKPKTNGQAPEEEPQVEWVALPVPVFEAVKTYLEGEAISKAGPLYTRLLQEAKGVKLDAPHD